MKKIGFIFLVIALAVVFYYSTSENKETKCTSLSIFKNKSIIENTLDSIICYKSKDNGMQLTINSLMQNEYDYLRANSTFLPNTPFHSDSIDIDFYRDDFLGDYGLQIRIKVLNQNQKLSNDSKWIINEYSILDSSNEKDSQYLEFYFHKGEN